MRTPYTAGYHECVLLSWSHADERDALYALHLSLKGTLRWWCSDADFFRHMWE